MGSTRFPGKVMEKIDDENRVTDYVVNQIKSSKLIEKIIVAIPNLAEDDIFYQHLLSKKISTYRGSSNNVLDRYYQCAQNESGTVIVRITADNPLVDPEVVDKTIKKFMENEYDYVGNIHPKTFPNGTEVEVFSFYALETAWKQTKDVYDLEHVTPYFSKNPDKFKLGNLSQTKDESNYRWTVDYVEDLEFIKYVVNKIPNRPILINNIMNLIKNPHNFKITKNYN